LNNTLVGILFAVLIVGIVLFSIRKGKLKEKYAFLWLLVSLFSSAAVIFPEPVFKLANSLGFKIPANFLFAITLLVSLLLIFLLSTDISKKQRQIENLATELALIKNKLKN
jgi:hypothetical protein